MGCPRCGASDPCPCGRRGWSAARPVLLAGLVAVGLAVAFAASEDAPVLSVEDAEAAADAAVAALEADLAHPEGGALRLVRAEAHVKDPMPGAATLEVEWGTDGARSLLEARGGGHGARIETYCAPERVVVVRDGMARDERPTGDLGPCTRLLEGPAGPMRRVSALPVAGGVDAVYEDGSGRSHFVRVEAGRVVRVALEEGAGHAVLRFDHGPRHALEWPEAHGRLAARLEAVGFWHGDRYEWRAHGGQAGPLDGFEVVVRDHGRTLARFGLTAEAQEQNGLAFRFEDDGDGVLGAGDAFAIESDLRPDGLEVLVWDRWAGAPLRVEAGLAWLAPLAVALGARFKRG